MAINREQAVDCAGASLQTGHRLSSIMDVIVDVRGSSDRIADATSKSHSVSESIGRQVIQLAVLAESIKAGMDASTIQSANVHQCSEDLKSAAEKFSY